MKERKKLGGIRAGPDAKALFRAIVNEGARLRWWFMSGEPGYVALGASDIVRELERLGWEIRERPRKPPA